MSRALVSILVVLLGTAWPVIGQSTFGSIVGVVHDASQSSIAGASIQIRSLEDNSVHSTTADADGSFGFVNLKPRQVRAFSSGCWPSNDYAVNDARNIVQAGGWPAIRPRHRV